LLSPRRPWNKRFETLARTRARIDIKEDCIVIDYLHDNLTFTSMFVYMFILQAIGVLLVLVGIIEISFRLKRIADRLGTSTTAPSTVVAESAAPSNKKSVPFWAT
jgi:hypothetical protein